MIRPKNCEKLCNPNVNIVAEEISFELDWNMSRALPLCASAKNMFERYYWIKWFVHLFWWEEMMKAIMLNQIRTNFLSKMLLFTDEFKSQMARHIEQNKRSCRVFRTDFEPKSIRQLNAKTKQEVWMRWGGQMIIVVPNLSTFMI